MPKRYKVVLALRQLALHISAEVRAVNRSKARRLHYSPAQICRAVLHHGRPVGLELSRLVRGRVKPSEGQKLVRCIEAPDVANLCDKVHAAMARSLKSCPYPLWGKCMCPEHLVMAE